MTDEKEDEVALFEEGDASKGEGASKSCRCAKEYCEESAVVPGDGCKRRELTEGKGSARTELRDRRMRAEAWREDMLEREARAEESGRLWRGGDRSRFDR